MKKARKQNVYRPISLLTGIQLVEAFNQVVDGFHLLQERFQFIQRQRMDHHNGHGLDLGALQ